jgi:hypothetical protein
MDKVAGVWDKKHRMTTSPRSAVDIQTTASLTSSKPVVTVVTVVDYTYQGDRTVSDLKATITALAAQDFAGPLEFLLVESADRITQVPPELTRILPSLKILSAPFSTSYELMNAGARAAAADIVAFVDGDCVPAPDWIRRLVDTFRARPDTVGVSGLTLYEGDSFRDRVMALLSRSYLDPGRPGPTRFFCNNNGGMRREVLLRHPLPVAAGPYASRLQTEAIWRAGGRFEFEPQMRLVHDYEGWGMEWDIRRHHGFSTVITRRMDSAMPYAWLVRLGYAGIPIIVAAKILDNWADCLRCAHHYRVQWYELPVAMALSVVIHLMEIPGMIRAFRGRPITRTRYR